MTECYSSFQTELETFLLQCLSWYPHTEEDTFHLCSSYILSYLVEKLSCPQCLSPFSVTTEVPERVLDGKGYHPTHTAVRCVHGTKFLSIACLLPFLGLKMFHSCSFIIFYFIFFSASGSTDMLPPPSFNHSDE